MDFLAAMQSKFTAFKDSVISSAASLTPAKLKPLNADTVFAGLVDKAKSAGSTLLSLPGRALGGVGSAVGSVAAAVTRPLIPTLVLLLVGLIVFYMILGRLQRT